MGIFDIFKRGANKQGDITQKEPCHICGSEGLFKCSRCGHFACSSHWYYSNDLQCSGCYGNSKKKEDAALSKPEAPSKATPAVDATGRVKCTNCKTSILLTTYNKHNGLCAPCASGPIEQEKRRLMKAPSVSSSDTSIDQKALQESLNALFRNPDFGVALNAFRSEEKARAAFKGLCHRIRPLKNARPVVVELFKNGGVPSLINEPFFIFLGLTSYDVFEIINPHNFKSDCPNYPDCELGAGAEWEVHVSAARQWRSSGRLSLLDRQAFL